MAEPLHKIIPGTLPTPHAFATFDGKLQLRCKACAAVGKYAVGQILINPDRAKSGGFSEGVGFLNLIRCRKCHGEGPWELTTMSLAQLVLMMSYRPLPDGILVTKMVLFDGTCVGSSAEAVAHLRGLVEKDPQDYFLWGRLGNCYVAASEHRLAQECFHKAIELNPRDVESHDSLGNYYFDQENFTKAAEHYHAVLRHCREAPPRTTANMPMLRAVVRSTFENLLAIHEATGGQIDVIPPTTTTPDDPAARRAIEFRSFDLNSDRDWEKIVDMILHARPLPRPLSPRLLAPAAPAPGSRKTVGRNDRCPCRSGRKYKNCCGRP